MRGRKRKPEVLHALHGNPSKLNMRKRREPRAPGTLDAPPDWMTDEQKASWTYAVDNAPLGILRAADRGTLAVWIVAEDTHRRAAANLRAGLLVRNGDRAVASPFVGIMHKVSMVMIKAASELGFTPVSRARLAGAGLEVPHETPIGQKLAASDEFERHMAAKPSLN